jgi:hypothetical protein
LPSMISIVPFSIALSLTLQSALRSTASTYHPRSAQGGRHRTLTHLITADDFNPHRGKFTWIERGDQRYNKSIAAGLDADIKGPA